MKTIHTFILKNNIPKHKCFNIKNTMNLQKFAHFYVLSIVESARSIPYGGIKLLEIMYSLPTISP
jgi:hypothetical protein